MVAGDGRRDFVPVGFGASHGRTRHPVNAGGSGASNSGWIARTGVAEPPAKTLRHAHRRRLLRFNRTIQQGRSRAQNRPRARVLMRPPLRHQLSDRLRSWNLSERLCFPFQAVASVRGFVSPHAVSKTSGSEKTWFLSSQAQPRRGRMGGGIGMLCGRGMGGGTGGAAGAGAGAGLLRPMAGRSCFGSV